jgi:hypothetical protein
MTVEWKDGPTAGDREFDQVKYPTPVTSASAMADRNSRLRADRLRAAASDCSSMGRAGTSRGGPTAAAWSLSANYRRIFDGGSENGGATARTAGSGRGSFIM